LTPTGGGATFAVSALVDASLQRPPLAVQESLRLRAGSNSVLASSPVQPPPDRVAFAPSLFSRGWSNFPCLYEEAERSIVMREASPEKDTK
jgi:hypothetical protein